MFPFLDGACLVAAIDATAFAFWNRNRLQKVIDGKEASLIEGQQEINRLNGKIAQIQTVLEQETAVLEKWTKHVDSEAQVDYTSLVHRIKSLR